MKPLLHINHGSPVIAQGLRLLASDLADVTIASPGHRYTKDEGEYFAVSLEIYCSNISFFLPRKNRVLLICDRSMTVNSGEELPAILNIYDTEAGILSTISPFLKAQEPSLSDTGTLSAREIDVLRQLAKGKSFKEIAETLFISVNTVTTHRKNISAKLGIKSVSGLTVYAMMNGIV